jgi:hypothetical protein
MRVVSALNGVARKSSSSAVHALAQAAWRVQGARESHR